MTSPPAGRLYGSVNYGSMDALIAKVITAELSIRLDPVGPGNAQQLAGFPRQRDRQLQRLVTVRSDV